MVKARNYQSLSEAIQGAKDEELPTSKIYNIKGRNHQDNYNNRRPWINTQTKYLENNPHVPRGFQNAYSRNKSHVNFGTRKPPFRNHRNKKPTHNTFNCSDQKEKSNVEEPQTFFEAFRNNTDHSNHMGHVIINYGECKLKFLLDTGSSVNIIFSECLGNEVINTRN
ncbi:hypothetical protein WA026_021310 [Henosepilachna vigintioctopunctata]|uniref:Uncharacterized protein n=1 Tax=Henosepilachna vigintioctopunctata TaxID=420089 RepID=A0AAW1UG94_9CUCU